MVKQHHQFFVALFAAADGIVISCACFAAWLVRRFCIERVHIDAMWPQSWENYFKESLVMFGAPLGLYAMWGFGLYRARRDRTLVSEIGQVVKACAATIAGMVVVLWAVGNQIINEKGYGPAQLWGTMIDAGRLQLGTLTVALPVLVAGHRVAARLFLRELRRRGWNQRHVAVIGTGRLGQITARTLGRNNWTGLNVAYFLSHLDTTHRERCHDKPVMGGLNDLELALESHRVDAVYVALPNSRASELNGVLARLEKFPIDVRIVPDVTPRFVPQSMAVSELDGMPILSVRENPTTGVGGVSKRLLDIAGSLAGLIAFAPVMGVVALLVRSSGPGPIIFKQRRVSLGGQQFKIYKFRTMRYVEDEQGAVAAWTQRDDPRVTRVGRWLRRTSLDELPQLLNVLKGDMSLVGPRPERPELIARFKDDWRGYMLRHHVKAGMTGWAQVNGHRGQSSLKKRLQYDLFYVKNWSIWFDMKILALTVFRGFIHRNAH